MRSSVFYFAYGSNMSLARLLQRTPSAESRGVCTLSGYQLRFHKRGKDSSAKCDAYYTGLDDDLTWGVLYTLNGSDKPLLDQVEGLGRGYDEKSVELVLDGSPIEAFTYVATAIDKTLLPFDWYKQHVLVGAREANLPEQYIAGIECMLCITDSNRERAEREMSLYV